MSHYFGYTHHGIRQAFHSATRPTPQTHPQYHAVVGPYRTARRASIGAMLNIGPGKRLENAQVFNVPPRVMPTGADSW